jgi:hypothetical protein
MFLDGKKKRQLKKYWQSAIESGVISAGANSHWTN